METNSIIYNCYMVNKLCWNYYNRWQQTGVPDIQASHHIQNGVNVITVYIQYKNTIYVH